MPKSKSASNRLTGTLLRLSPLSGLSALALLGAVACTSQITDDPGAAGDVSTDPQGAGANSPPGSGSGTGTGSGSGTSGNGSTNGGSTGNPGNPSAGTGTGSNNGGSTSSGSGGSTSHPIDTTPPPVGGELSNCSTPGPRLIRRLTSVQFRNTLVDAFQDPNVPATDIFADPYNMRFRIDADIPVVRDLDAGLIMDYAETVAAWAVQNKLGQLAQCQTLTDQNCRQQFIKTVGLKLGREPVSSERLAAYDGLYKAENHKTFQDFATDVLTAMLESPYFIYRRELGVADGGTYKLTPYEIASQLSYFLTDSAPDQTLLDAAAAGKLANAADIDAQAARLLSTPAAKKTLSQFVDGWLEIDGLRSKTKDQNIFMLTDELRASMIRETEETFFDLFNNGGDLTKLLTTEQSFVNQPLGAFYQVQGGPSADSFTKVDLSSSTRAPGVLGQAAFLAQHAQPENSSPVQRGRAIRERFLCEPIPEVPKNLNTNLAAPGSFTTNRERFQQHSNDAICATCHKQFDPVGFAFENFDGFGRYRAEEKDAQGVTHPIDTSGTLSGMPEGDVPLTGAESLIDYLSTSDKVRACLVRYWSYYAHGRDNWTDKKCNDDSIRRESAQNGNTLKSVLMGILHAPSFTRRVQENQ